jgi:GDP-L-fucose synthase
MENNMKNMLICGATGFIGRNLTEFFSKQKEYSVTAVYHNRIPPTDIPNVKWVQADLNNVDDIKSVVKDMDIVLQYAATTSGAGDIVSRPHIHVTDNAVMNSLILRECYNSQVEHVVFPSCTVMYQPSGIALKESDYDSRNELLPNYFGVGNTKLYIEKMCEFYSRLGKTKHTVLRQSNIYGPHDKYDLVRSHFFGATVTKVMTNKDGILEVWGSGEERRDLLHVHDLLTAVQSAIKNQSQSFSIYNIGLGQDFSINEIVDKIIVASDKKMKVTHNLSKPSIKTSLFLDCKKANDELGWNPSIGIEQGISNTIEWYTANVLQEKK